MIRRPRWSRQAGVGGQNAPALGLARNRLRANEVSEAAHFVLLGPVAREVAQQQKEALGGGLRQVGQRRLGEGAELAGAVAGVFEAARLLHELQDGLDVLLGLGLELVEVDELAAVEGV